MKADKTRHPWVPPQREPGETTRHYVAILARTMRNLKAIYENPEEGHDLRQRSRNRYKKCRDLRDEAEMGHK